MKFIIRDDDLNYFSKPADITHWYSDIFAQNIPVGFAAIPFVTPTSDVYTNDLHISTDSAVEYPIGKNAELVSYVKNNPLIEIIQHGCTHQTNNRIFEYQQKKDLYADTLRGKKELEHAFERSVHVFSPPHDWIGVHGIYAIEQCGLHLLRGRGTGLRNIIVRMNYIRIFFVMFWFKFCHAFKKNIPVYPFVLDFGLHKEMCSYRLEDEDLFYGLEYTHKNKGDFVVVTHLHFYTKEKKDRLLALIKKAREYNVEFSYPYTLFT
jgi:hypothetical protein